MLYDDAHTGHSGHSGPSGHDGHDYVKSYIKAKPPTGHVSEYLHK